MGGAAALRRYRRCQMVLRQLVEGVQKQIGPEGRRGDTRVADESHQISFNSAGRPGNQCYFAFQSHVMFPDLGFGEPRRL